MRHDQLTVSERIALGDLDLAGQDHDKARTDFAGLHQIFALGPIARLAETAEPVHLVALELGKHLRAARVDGTR